MRCLLILLLLVAFVTSPSQVKRKSISDLGARIDYYTSQHQTDSAYICISKFLERKDIDTVEMFYGHLFLGQTYFQAKKNKEGFEQMALCSKLIGNGHLYAKCRYKLHLTISEEYFTLQQYDSARFHASSGLALLQEIKPVNLYDEARCYNILGYCSYLRKDYPRAVMQLQKSANDYMATDVCAVPLVYCKLAKVYNRTGQHAKCTKLLSQAISMCDSCQSKDNMLVCKYAQLEILKENHEYEKALICLEEINRMVEILDDDRQVDKIDQLEIEYKTRTKDYENNLLKQINQSNNKVLSKQRMELVISVIAILLMGLLSFLLVRLSRHRKTTLQEIEIKNLEIEMKNKELERLHHLNQKIFSVISHDFRGPILSLQLLMDTVEKENTPADLARYTRDISQQLVYASQTLDNLLNWARTEINIHMNDQTRANAYVISNEIISHFRSMAEKKQVRIVNDIPPTLVLPIPEDVLRIVFRNLISNAIKYSFENSDVKIYYDPDSQIITVKDYGIGIDDDKLNKLFSKNIESSLGTWQESGFGLGLYITHELLYRFGGQIRASRHKYGGTEFTIFILRVKD